MLSKKQILMMVAIFLWLGWAAVVLIPFFSINTSSFRPLLESFGWFAAALWFWLLALGLGWYVLKWFKGFEVLRASNRGLRGRLSYLLFSCGLGLGLLAMVMLMVGTIFGINAYLLFITIAVLVLLVGYSWHELFKELGSLSKAILLRKWNARERVVWLLVLGIACLQLPAALTPTIFPDTLRYHFGLTKIFIQAGQISYIPDFTEANISSNWQMIYLPQIVLSGDACAQIFNWMVLPLTAVIVGLAAGPGAYALAMLTFVSTPFLLGVAGLGNNDLGVAFFAALMWLAIRSKELRSHLLWAGIFGGLAIGTKYTALGTVIATIVAYTFFEPTKHRNRLFAYLLPLRTFCIGGFLGYLPWFIRNTIWTGDPVYPILSRWLPWCGPEGRWFAEHYSTGIAQYGSRLDGFLHVLFAPWAASVANSKYHFESDPGVIFWCAIPLVLWAVYRQLDNNKNGICIAAAASWVGGLIWAVGPQVTRFLAPMVPIFAITIGEAWKELNKVKPNLLSASKGATEAVIDGGRILRSATIYSIIFILLGINVWQALTSIADFSDPYHFFFQGMTRQQYLAQHPHLGSLYRTAQWLGAPHRVKSTVLLIGEEGVFFFQNPVRMSGPYDRKWIVDQVEEKFPPLQLAQKLKRAGIDFICLNKRRIQHMDQQFGYMNWFSEESSKRFEKFLEEQAHLVRVDGDVRLYWIPNYDL